MENCFKKLGIPPHFRRNNLSQSSPNEDMTHNSTPSPVEHPKQSNEHVEFTVKKHQALFSLLPYL